MKRLYKKLADDSCVYVEKYNLPEKDRTTFEYVIRYDQKWVKLGTNPNASHYIIMPNPSYERLHNIISSKEDFLKIRQILENIVNSEEAANIDTIIEKLSK